MAERVECEFQLLRYVPDAARGEFVNIGVVLRQADGTSMVRMGKSWTRVKSLDADADVAMLQALEAELQGRLAEGDGERRSLLEVLAGSGSNQVQLAEARASLAESVPAEMERLLGMYVDAPRRTSQTKDSGRTAVLIAMRRVFESAGVWPLMRKNIRVAEYTDAGDPLRIDCGYRPNGTIRMFQAVSLAGDLEGAKVLAYAARDLGAGVRRKENAGLELTAIVAPLREAEGGAEAVEQYQFAVKMMERETIRVMTTSDLERVADTARRELQV